MYSCFGKGLLNLELLAKPAECGLQKNFGLYQMVVVFTSNPTSEGLQGQGSNLGGGPWLGANRDGEWHKKDRGY